MNRSWSPAVPARLLRKFGPVGLASLLLVSGCSDAVGPTNDEDTEVPVPASYDGAQLGALIADESSRIVPSLGNESTRSELASVLEQLTRALRSHSDVSARAALSSFSSAITRFDGLAAANADMAAELDALRMAVDIVRDALRVEQ